MQGRGIAILSFYSGHVNRGVERWTHDMATAWKQTHEVVVCQTKSFGLSNYKQVIIPTTINWSAFAPHILKLIYFDYWSLKVAVFTVKSLLKLRRESIDIYIPTNGGWQTVIVRVYTWLFHKKMIVVGHAGIGRDDFHNIWSFPDIFVALSSSAMEWTKRVNPFLKNVSHIPDGVDTRMFTPRGKKLRIELPHPIFLSVGALTSSKRHDLAIKAVSGIKEASMLIVGKGEDHSKLDSLGNKLMPNRYKIINLDFHKMPEAYRLADVFTIPSTRHYAFEMVIIEALACNIPVVVNDDPIRREIVGQAGLFANPENIKEYRKTLRQALETDWNMKPVTRSGVYDMNLVASEYEKIFVQMYE